MDKNNRIWHIGRRAYFFLDYIVLCSVVTLAYAFSPKYSGGILRQGTVAPEIGTVVPVLPLFLTVGLMLAGLQRSRVGMKRFALVAQSIVGVGGGMLGFVILYAVVHFSLVGRYVLGMSFCGSIVYVVGSRWLVWRMVEGSPRRIVVYGHGDLINSISKEIVRRQSPIKIVGVIERWSESEMSPTDVAAMYSEAVGCEASEIVIDKTRLLKGRERAALLYCVEMGLKVSDAIAFFEREFDKVLVDGIEESWFWEFDPAFRYPIYFAVKRVSDVLISLIGLLCFAPIWGVLGIINLFAKDGPLLYRQVRVGYQNRPFMILKIRTMRADAEKDGARWASTGDSRVTPLGRFLRKTRIDECPQFWNILKGEMSLVGPRPERPEMIEKIEREVPFYRYRHLVKPGLSGWAQINYPYGASIEDAREKFAFDLFYIKYSSFSRELHIILRTSVAMARGAR